MHIGIKIMNTKGHMRNVPPESEINIVSGEFSAVSGCLKELESGADEFPEEIRMFIISAVRTLTKEQYSCKD